MTKEKKKEESKEQKSLENNWMNDDKIEDFPFIQMSKCIPLKN